jgi:hypothetical protein
MARPSCFLLFGNGSLITVAAMFVMAGTFGLRQAGMISNRAFGLGAAAVVVVLLGGTMWATSGFWAPYGAIGSIPESVLLAWVFVTSVFLYRRSPITVATRTRPAVNAA